MFKTSKLFATDFVMESKQFPELKWGNINKCCLSFRGKDSATEKSQFLKKKALQGVSLSIDNAFFSD